MRKSEFVTFAKCFSNDIDNYNEKLKVLSKEKNFKLDILGYLNNNLKDKIILIDHYISNELPSILIAGSFHGEEPAGAWGILKFLHDINKNDINKINKEFTVTKAILPKPSFILGEKVCITSRKNRALIAA